jgi:hypothetical protein
METRKGKEKGFGISQSEYKSIVMFLRQLPIPLYVEKVAPGVIVKDKEGHKVWLKNKRELRAFKTIIGRVLSVYSNYNEHTQMPNL